MDRRAFVRNLGISALAGGGLAACGREEQGSAAPAAQTQQTHEWRMVTTWPENFPGMGTGAEHLARQIQEMSGGRIQVTVYAAGELVPAFESFEAVSNNTAQMGHGAAYYWKGKTEAAQFFSAVPFGFTAQEMNAWLYHGGGMELWEEAYAPFGLVPMAAANTGVQMAGWFNHPINDVSDLKGLKMRIPGLGGEVLERVGGSPVNLPGGEIFTALQSGTIDATEWVGPWNDLAFGLHKAADYYYYPGWHEPGTTLEAFVNQEAFNALSDDLKAIVRAACQAANLDLLSEFTARNHQALETLRGEGVDIRRLPDDALTALRQTSEEVVGDIAAASDLAGRIHDSYRQFRDRVVAWHDVSERAYLNARSG